MKKIRENKAFRIVKGIINILLMIFCILFVLVVCLQRFSNNKLSFFDYRMFTVVSGSMEPRYMIGDVLIAKHVPAEEIKVGDSISYLGKRGSFNGMIITHEVIDIEKDASGKYIYHTKGLTNIVEDPIVDYDQVYGKIIRKSVILSFIYMIVGSKYGIFLFIIIPLFYIIGSEILSFMLEKEEKRRSVQ